VRGRRVRLTPAATAGAGSRPVASARRAAAV